MSQLPPSIDLPAEERKILQFWQENDIFQTSLRQSVDRSRYTFYDGPPFATGLPHYGHLLTGTIKDIITRYAHQRGFHVERRFGWDCHGLPVEYEVDKELGINGPQDVNKMGVASYNNKCRAIVMRYSTDWEKVTKRLGRWIDFENDYRTMYPWFMESVWWVFKQLFDKGLVYRGVKVMPFSTACSTPLSNFEAGQNYRDVQDPAVIVSFPLECEPEVELIAWTTTPWTLVSNLSLCVHPDKEYVKIADIIRNRVFIMMRVRLASLYKNESEYKILETFKGKCLEGKAYQPIFDYFISLKERRAFRVLCDNYVTEDIGTGVVHQAPYFGEDDFRVCLQNGIISKDTPMICPVDCRGLFTSEVVDFVGLYVKEADKLILKNLKQRKRLIHQGTITHSYPFCWRSDTPLIYKAVPTWFIRVEQLVDRLLDNNSKCHWVPDFVREGRFANWLRDARDWAISRNRFWGTPIPLWVSEDFEELVCIGSIAELKAHSGVEIHDLHKEFVDPITIPSKTGRGVLRRVAEVFDCWFESGSMPYAQLHYPFENVKKFEDGFPADFIAEGIDQTRGWFYTLLVLSTALFDQPPFKNLIVNGIVLASDGQKMSKRAKNYPDPLDVIEKNGADALRLYLINSPVVRAQNLRFMESGVHDLVKDLFLPWYNALRFLIESSIIPFERLTDHPFVIKPDAIPETRNFMDHWILSFIQSLILFVHEELANYRLYTVVPRLVKFIDHLVNWYVRMNRKRLKGDSVEDQNDWHSALHTLMKVIYQMTCLMSSFTPFITEFIYQQIKSRLDFTENLKGKTKPLPGYCPITGAPDSVHYLPTPQAHECLIAKEIEDSVSWMQATVELGRVIRTRCNLPLKAPLREAVVIHSDPTVLKCVLCAKDYIMDELNVRTLTSTDDKHKYGVQLRGILNHRTLGIRLKKAYQSVVNAMKNTSTEELEKFIATGHIVVCGHTLSGDDLSVVYTTAPNGQQSKQNDGQIYEAASDHARSLLVLLDITPDQDLIDEHLARELVNRIQRTRKKANLIPEDPIVIILVTESEDIERIANPNGKLYHLIQTTVKQPMFTTRCHSIQLLEDIVSKNPNTFSSGDESSGSVFVLGSEIIKEPLSIPLHEGSLILYRRCSVAFGDNNSKKMVNGIQKVTSKTLSKSPNMIISNPINTDDATLPCPDILTVKHFDDQRVCHVTLKDSHNMLLVRDSDDLVRKVRCAFGWSKSVNLFLHRRNLSDPKNLELLEYIPQKHILSLSGQCLYATPKV